MRLRFSILLFSVVLSTTGTSAQSRQTLTGTVSDPMCGAHHTVQGASAAPCLRELRAYRDLGRRPRATYGGPDRVDHGRVAGISAGAGCGRFKGSA